VRIFLLLPTTPTRAVSGRSRLRRAGFPIGTRRCRSSEEVHSLLGWRACAYRERRTLPQKLWLSFEAHFGLSFVNPNIWHLIYNNFNLNFIFGTVCLCVCVCVFSLRRESPDMILGYKPLIFEGVLSQLVPEQDWSKTHTKASKNQNNAFGEERLAHIRTLVVFLGGKLTYVLIYATMELHQRRYVVIFGVFILFYCWCPYFIVCGICITIRTCVCLLLLFMDIFGCLCLADSTWVGTSVLVFVDMSEYFGIGPLWTWVKNDDWCDPSSAGTLTHVKTIETCVESASATVCVQSAIAGCFLLFCWGRLGRVHCIKSPEQRSLITS
jgi:hypothetical protein